jgi:hypothetical protein
MMNEKIGSHQVIDLSAGRREILSLTLVFDHDVIDGAPAARFTHRLVELIESGYGLNEDQTNSAIETKPARVRTEYVYKE